MHYFRRNNRIIKHAFGTPTGPGRDVPRFWESGARELGGKILGVIRWGWGSDWGKYFGFYPYLALDTICGRWYGVPFRFACTGVGDSPARLIKWWGVADLQLSALKILSLHARVALFALLNRQRVGVFSLPMCQKPPQVGRKIHIFWSLSSLLISSTLAPILPPISTSPT